MALLIGGITLLSYHYNLNNIKSKTVGDGQHGIARFATKNEVKKTYEHIPFNVKDWRENKFEKPLPQGLIIGCQGHKNNVTAMVDTNDVHCLMIGASGVGKTAYFLYPNLEYACASGMSFIVTDTKGDVEKNYGAIAKDDYGYNISVLDLRNPMRSDGNNLLHLVNTYMDIYLADDKNISAKAKAEKYAKIIAKTIVNSTGESHGQNSYFYDSAEGLLAAVILLVAEFLPHKQRHIVSVFKLVQDLLEPIPPIKGKPPKTQFQVLMEKLPDTHKAKWLSGAALNSSEQGMASVLSTVLSKLNAFLDSEMENILCFDTEIDAEKFCTEKSAVFIILPEEDPLKYFMVSLFLQQFYREMLTVADECGGKLPNRVVLYCDEIGTIPPIDSFEMMLSAGRSRGITVVPIIQSFAQLRKNYGDEGSEIITDNTQLTIFGGFAPNSKTAEELSKALGNRTVMSGSVSKGKDNPSQSLQMMERPLMTPEELKSLPKGNFVVMKTGVHPVRTKLKLFLDWGITFDKIFTKEERKDKEVYYANRQMLEVNIEKKYTPPKEETPVNNDKKANTQSYTRKLNEDFKV
ncbi:MAG: type IV secretory system conjugative DNA transfer family protein [Clostridia bacterium]